MYRIGICSIDKKIVETIEKMIIEKYQLKIRKYTIEEELLKEVKNQKFIDILIMDMQWSKHCITLAKIIQERYLQVKLIFIAANVKDALNIFEADPTYLLLRPLDKQRLYCAIEKAIQRLESSKEQMMKVQYKDKFICIPFQEIVFIESDLRYLIIHQKSKTDKIMMKMSDIEERLPDYFIRCHQSYIFNIHLMAQFEKHRVVMRDGSCIPVSRNRLEEAQNGIEKYYGLMI